MVNVADLVKAVKEKKEHDYNLFDKVDFICRFLGKKYNNDGIDTYLYEGDNLRFALNTGRLLDRSIFKEAIVQTLDHNNFFCYFKNVSEGKGRVDLYIPGDWEELVEEHYKRSLEN